MPEDVAYISSKSGVDMSRDGKVMSVAKKVPTDGQMAFRLYIVDTIVIMFPYSHISLQRLNQDINYNNQLFDKYSIN